MAISNTFGKRNRKTSVLNLDQLEARMLCAIDTAIANIEQLTGPDAVGAPNVGAATRNSAPTLTQRITIVNPSQPITTSVGLSALGRDDGGESNLRYTWSVSSTSQGASGSFSANASNAAKNTLLTFTRAGTYTVQLTVTDAGGLSSRSTLRFSVRQTLTSIEITPGSASVAAQASRQFTARGLDQFGQALTTQPNFTWSTSAGSISSKGLFTAPSSAGSATITARVGTLSRTAAVTVTASTPSPSPSPTPTPTPTPVPTNNLTNAQIRNLVTTYVADNSISRTEMIQLLRNAGTDGTVDNSELTDFRYIVTNASRFGVADYVKSLANSVVNTNSANAQYQGTSAGNLTAGSSATLLNKLVDKWFLGTDLPTLTNSALSYRTASGALFNGTPSLSDMKQGAIGDCYFISAVAALGARNPSAVQNMFIDNGDGTFTVRFYTGSYGMFYNSDGSISTGFRSGTTATADYVTVNRSLATYSSGALAYSGSGSLATNTSNTLWIALAEKAYAQWNETGKAGRDIVANSFSSIESGWMGEVSAQVLGYNTTDYVLASVSQAALTNALAANRAVTIGTKGNATIGGLVGGHAYVVSAFNSATSTFTLVNPWGSSHPGQLSWSQLVTACDWFSVANPSNSVPIAQRVSATPSVRGQGDAMAPAGAPIGWSSSILVTTNTVVEEIQVATVATQDIFFADVTAEDAFAEDNLDVAILESTMEDISNVLDTLLSNHDLDEVLAIELAV